MHFVDLVEPVMHAKLHVHSLILWPERWKTCVAKYPNWSILQFDKSSANNVPDAPGVYGFLIQPRIAADLNASYLMYIGQTGRSLRTRYKEYLREANSPTGRPKVKMLLNLYEGFLYFTCAVTDPAVSPTSLEDELLGAFIPPMNPDLPVEVREIRAALT